MWLVAAVLDSIALTHPFLCAVMFTEYSHCTSTVVDSIKE